MIPIILIYDSYIPKICEVTLGTATTNMVKESIVCSHSVLHYPSEFETLHFEKGYPTPCYIKYIAQSKYKEIYCQSYLS